MGIGGGVRKSKTRSFFNDKFLLGENNRPGCDLNLFYIKYKNVCKKKKVHVIHRKYYYSVQNKSNEIYFASLFSYKISQYLFKLEICHYFQVITANRNYSTSRRAPVHFFFFSISLTNKTSISVYWIPKSII